MTIQASLGPNRDVGVDQPTNQTTKQTNKQMIVKLSSTW